MNTNDRSGSRRNNAHRRSYHTPMEMPSGPKSSSRRHPSQSPEVWAGQHQTPLGISMPPVAESSQSDQNRRKKAGNPTSVPAGSRPFIVAADEANSERGRKFKPKQRSHNRYLPENVAHTGATPVVEAPVPMIKRERSRSQDSSRQRSKAGASDVDSSVRSLLDLPSDYSGPLAAAEFARLKREVESLRKLTHENKKVMKKQNKLIEELRQQDSTTQEKLKESESQVQQLQSKAKKAEEWEPPAVFIDEDEYLFDGLDVSDINILRRGGTLRMLHEFDMRYNHEDGLIAHDDDYNRYYLGWNIRLSADDENGEGYMRYLMEDMNNRPERWRIMEYDNGTYDAHLLVREDEVHAYAETDSDYYNMDVDDHD
ncbi:hypothetical protein ID866_7516 [Astraeus odoratus]|nr:hypothetical protein ID866_7516 [Astraeus odoratus]